jgi:ATP adenylyltransferase/5',5'''-P-1,P-4-tetraphosphate phosphorylase II
MMTKQQKNDRFKDFLTAQNHTWKLSKDNYCGLDQVLEKTHWIDGFQIKVQFNPERMRSSAAKVDPNSIAARKCFLCCENRPIEQKSIDVGNDFLILVNPFPIFRSHFTLPSVPHIPQLLIENLEPMFDLSRQMEGYTLFYNGPECGASAPDHLHFQAGENGFLPVESEFDDLKLTNHELLLDSDSVKIRAFDHYLRKMISVETDSAPKGVAALRYILTRFNQIQSDKVESMVNLLCIFKTGKWIIHLFPRKLHRPTQFFEQGVKQLLISPAAVDFGGVLITPRKEDFEKITTADIRDIFNQVSLDKVEFFALKESIKN